MAEYELPKTRSAADADVPAYERFLVVGPTGSGKSGLIWTLPGRKFVYVFDPNTMPTIRGCPDCDIVEFYPDILELDSTLKGFNKGAKSDKPSTSKEPTLYMRWVQHFNRFVDNDLKQYDWLVFDSLTFLAKSVMDRQLYINNRYGDIEDLGDYRVVGSKLSDVFNSISGLPINILCTGHLTVYQDDKTKKIVTQIMLPGKARNMLPLSHTNVLHAFSDEGKYFVRTVPDERGLKEIRSSIKGLKPEEDVTIKDFKHATDYGIGKLLKGAR
jgi:hypothetical protein